VIALSQDVLVDETPSLSGGECIECRATAARARRLAARIRCRCGAELIPPVRTDEALLQRLLDASEQMARWAPYFQGSAIDYDRRREPERLLTPAEREQLDAKNERARSCARGLFVRLESLRTEAARTRGPELVRAVAVIDWLVERCGSERTKGARIGGEVVAPKLSKLVGEAFADEATKQRARAVPPVARRAPSDPPPKAPPSLEFTEDPVFTTETPEQRERALAETLSIRAQEWSTWHQAQGVFVVEGLVWLLRRLLHAHHERERQRTAAEIRADAEQAKLAIERHGAELLRDASWAWSATDVATEEPQRGFEEICSAAITRIKTEQERRKRAEEQR